MLPKFSKRRRFCGGHITLEKVPSKDTENSSVGAFFVGKA
jgi:hypothetical protein